MLQQQKHFSCPLCPVLMKKIEQCVCSLSRDMPSPTGILPLTHTYFKRFPVEVHNASVLTSLPGSELTFECVGTGIAKSLDKGLMQQLR